MNVHANLSSFWMRNSFTPMKTKSSSRDDKEASGQIETAMDS